MDYGTLMVHNPSGSDDKKVLGLIKDTLVTILTNRSTCSAEEIETMMNKETWLNAEEAVQKGFADEIIESKKKVKVKKSESLVNRMLIYNKIINPEYNMTKINNVLKLKNDASEESAVEAIESINNENSSLKTENDALKKENDLLKAEKKTAEDKAALDLKNKATALADSAVKEGKISESEKENTIALAIANYDGVAALINKMGSSKEAQKIFDVKNVKKTDGTTEDRSGWNYTDWSKKDEKGLHNMFINNRAAYDELYNKEFKK
jgi:hypothetical protein